MSLKINLRNKSYWLLKTMSTAIKGAFYVPHHKKPYRKTEGWDCQHCVEGEHWSWQKVHSSDLDEINTRIRNEENKMRCRGCGSRRPGYSVVGFGLQKRRDQDKIYVREQGKLIKSRHCIPDGYASLDEWIKHLKTNVVPMMKQKYNFWEVITLIPIEIFEENIFTLRDDLQNYSMIRPKRCEAFTPFKDQKRMIRGHIIGLARCSQVCRSWYSFFKQNIFWRTPYLYRRVLDFYEQRLETLANTKMKNLRSCKWTNDEIFSNPCTLKIVNDSKIPFDIYWIPSNIAPAAYSCKGTVSGDHSSSESAHMHRIESEGESEQWRPTFTITTYPNHKWFCIPKLSWLYDNHVSSLGFAWNIDIFNLVNVDSLDKEGKVVGTAPVSMTLITDKNPADYKFIAGTKKEYKNYQHAVMRQVIERDLLINRKKHNTDMLKLNSRDRRTLQKRLDSKNHTIHYYESRNKEMDYALKIIQ